jgi:putative holliday junction resolvase
VGLPLSLNGQDSEQTRETRRFAARLARRLGEGVPVELHDERLTTRIAQRMGAHPPAAPEDSRAAAVMLESWLSTPSTPSSPSGVTRTTRQGRTEGG